MDGLNDQTSAWEGARDDATQKGGESTKLNEERSTIQFVHASKEN